MNDQINVAEAQELPVVTVAAVDTAVQSNSAVEIFVQTSEDTGETDEVIA